MRASCDRRSSLHFGYCTARNALRTRVLGPESYGAKLVSVDSGQAAAKVVRDGDFVGVVAADELGADRAVQALKSGMEIGAATLRQRVVCLSEG